jgi:hypothetical protein
MAADTATVVAHLVLVVAVITGLINSSSYFSVTASEVTECRKLYSVSRIREENAIKLMPIDCFVEGESVGGFVFFAFSFSVVWFTILLFY